MIERYTRLRSNSSSLHKLFMLLCIGIPPIEPLLEVPSFLLTCDYMGYKMPLARNVNCTRLNTSPRILTEPSW